MLRSLMNNPDTKPQSSRRNLLLGALGCAGSAAFPSWAQSTRNASNATPLAIAQIIDSSPDCIDVSKDFLVGSRAAWIDINRNGGIRGRQVQHLVFDADDKPATLHSILDDLQKNSTCVAISGAAGDRVASQLTHLLAQRNMGIAQVAPWLQNARMLGDDHTFPIFSSQQDQISHAMKSLSVMGIPEVGVVFANNQQATQHRQEIEQIGRQLALKLRTMTSRGDDAELGAKLPADSPRILLFIGGTPELLQFLTGLNKQVRQHYVIALADVNLQTMLQMGAIRHTAVMATQVVPMLTSSLPVVKSYRKIMAGLFDEPPTPQSLAGFVAARYTAQVLNTVEGALTRQSALAAFQRRQTMEVGGFQVRYADKQRSGAFVTQSMITPDGRMLG